MDLPEIRTAVARFLNYSELTAAAAVCRSWNASFTPILYSVVNWASANKIPSRKAIMANADLIQELCLNFTTRTCEVECLYSHDQLLLLALRKLTLKVQSAFPVEHQLEIIRKSPRLKILDWIVPEPAAIQVLDIRDLFKTSCPLVESLTLRGVSMDDNDLSQVLDDCHKIKDFTIDPCTFGESAFRSLTRHFTYLQVVSVYQSGITSKMTHAILTSCPNLTTFHGDTLDARDILGVVEDGNMTDYEVLKRQQPQDWVCSNLQVLDVFICGLEFRPLEWHRRVFQQIGKMTRLTMLKMGAKFLEHNVDSHDGLDLRLGAGLDSLGSLKLRLFFFRGVWQQMDECDVLWMRDAWPDGVYIVGKLHDDPERRSVLKGMLQEREGVRHC